MILEKIEKNSLLKPLQLVIGIIERKQSLPILSNVLIEKDDLQIKLTASDLEIQVATLCEEKSSISSKYAITTNARKLLDILRTLPENNDIILKSKDNKLQVLCGKSKFHLQMLPAQDFPKIQKTINQNQKIQISQQLLKKLLSNVQYAMAQQDIRYYLNGVLLSLDGNQIRVVATDGHRLAFSSSTEEISFNRADVIIPRKTINELTKLLSDTDDVLNIVIDENQITFDFSFTSMTSKVIDGKFPDYQRVIPSYTEHLLLDIKEILAVLQRVSILSNEKFHGVRFILTEKNLRIQSNNSEQEEAEEDMEINFSGNALDIAFNVNYLLDSLNNIPSQNVVFSFGGPNSSILITIPGQDDYKYVVMPMRI